MEENYEDKRQERLIAVNNKLISEFKKRLKANKISKRTIEMHSSNIELYGNDYLINYEEKDLIDGYCYIGSFLGSRFIRKCIWASETSMKQYITSLKKFSSWMLEASKLDQDNYNNLIAIIKEGKDDWLETIRKYDDPDTDFEDVFPNPY